MTDFYTLAPDQQVDLLEKLARQVLEEWCIAESDIRLLKYRENAVFAITDTATGSRFAMRIHRFGYHSNAELRSELQWMKALDTAGISTPPVIPTCRGKLFVVAMHEGVPEPRQIDLLGWVAGTPIGSIENDVELSREEIERNHYIAGQLAARIHNQSEHWQKPQGFVRKAWDEEGLLGEGAFLGRFWELELLTVDQRELLQKAKLAIQKKLAVFGKSQDRYGLTHADFLPENLLSDGEVVRIIDFDDCGFGWHVMDIATSLFFLLGESGYETACNGLIDGYRSERALPYKCLEMLPTFLLARGMTYLGWVHSRRETETAQEIAPVLVEGVCALAEDYMATN